MDGVKIQSKLTLDEISKLPLDHQNIICIFDRSQKGSYALSRFLSAGPRSLATSLAAKLDSLQTKPRYIGLLGLLQYTGGTTAFADSIDDFIEQVLPKFMQRVTERGGCAIALLGVDDAVRPVLSENITRLAPKLDQQGQVVPSAVLRSTQQWSHQAPLPPPMYGGTPRRFSEVVFEQPMSMGVFEMIKNATEAWLATGDSRMANASAELLCEELPNGTLRVAALMPDRMAHLDLTAGQWRSRKEENQRVAGVVLRDVAGPSGPVKSVEFARHLIERQDIEAAVRLVGAMLASPAAAAEHAGRVAITVDGYNEDPRDLLEIPEVRTFFQALHREWPYFPLLLEKVQGEFLLFFGLAADGRRLGDRNLFHDASLVAKAAQLFVVSTAAWLESNGVSESDRLYRQFEAAAEQIEPILTGRPLVPANEP